MNTFEKCETIRRIIVNRAAGVMAYASWPEKFAAEQVRGIPGDIKKMTGGGDLFGIQPADLTYAQMESLGFGKWSDENPMRLIPLWLLPFLADEIATESIDGEKKLKKADMDNDQRSGCLAYGVVPFSI